MVKPKAVLIAGPTASGKTSLAIFLARWLTHRSCVILNADSMQVYDGLHILTARPTPEQEAAVPHRLFGIASCRERFSVGRWLDAARRELAHAESTDRLPIFVGGTGLYFKALTKGLAKIPDISEELLQWWRMEGQRLGIPVLYDLLARRDPDMAQILCENDGQRIIRALSVLDATGRSLLDWWNDSAQNSLLSLDDCVSLFLDPDRDWLRGRIDARFDAMMRAGALDEVRSLHMSNLEQSLPAMRAHGVPHLLLYLEGHMDLETAVSYGKRDTWRYAKRQKTWFRHQMSGWSRVSCDASFPCQESLCQELCHML